MTQRSHTARALRAGGATALAVAAAGAVLAPAPAGAVYGPGGDAVSARGTQLAGDSFDPLVSGDGRYVVFRTQAALLLGVPPRAEEAYAEGIVRRDLVTGETALVAPPRRVLRSDGSTVNAGVPGPPAGISDDGRYVAFGTAVALTGADQARDTPDVYVRDMTRSFADQGAYELASARDGAAQGARYRDDDPGAVLGSYPGRSGFTLSDDGRRVAFATATQSDLPAADAVTTPRWQVLVRDLDTQRTLLVSRDRTDGSEQGLPADGGPDVAAPWGLQVPAPTPALSGNGDAVVWEVPNPSAQASFRTGEELPPTAVLWRELAPGGVGPARRVAGVVDPEAPGCDQSARYDPLVPGPCDGPFEDPEAFDEDGARAGRPGGSLSISDDGLRVVFNSAAKQRGYQAATHRPWLVVADMRPGVSRRDGVRRIGVAPRGQGSIGIPVLAGNGSVVLGSSQRAQFDGFQPIGRFQAGSLDANNLFAFGLDAGTVERVTSDPDGSDYVAPRLPGQDEQQIEVGNRSISDDGSVVVFDATDGNLFVGDGNGRTDVLVVRRNDPSEDGREVRDRRPLPPSPGSPQLVEPPLQPLPVRHASFGTVTVRPDGTAIVRVRVPAAGTVQAVGGARVPAPRTARSRRRSRGGRRAATRRRRSTRARGRAARVRLRSIVVGRAIRRATRPDLVTLHVHPSSVARRAVRRDVMRLAVTLRLSYRAAAADGGGSGATKRYEIVRARRGSRR